MRSMTNEEARWLARFDYSYNRKRTDERSYKQDTMRGVRVKVEISSLEDISVLNNFKRVGEDVEESCIKTSIRQDPHPRRPVPYSPRDYWVLPNLWYSGNWGDRVIDLIDREKGEVVDTEVPGIIVKDNLFLVNVFFEYKNVCIGIFKTSQEAKDNLISYNKRKTHRGYGVDWT